MQRIPLASSALVSAGYDPDTCELELEFRGGRIYRYGAVPKGVYDFLLRTKHKGSYVSRMIVGRYSHEDVSPAAEEQDVLSALRASLERAQSERRRADDAER
jgi:lysyl-tRNA synthetase class 2